MAKVQIFHAQTATECQTQVNTFLEDLKQKGCKVVQIDHAVDNSPQYQNSSYGYYNYVLTFSALIHYTEPKRKI